MRVQQFGQGSDDSIRPNVAVMGQPLPFGIVPYTVDAQFLRNCYLPLQVVAHHPRFPGHGVQEAERIRIDSNIRLSVAVLSFDENGIEEWRKIEPAYLIPLWFGASVRYQRHPHPAGAKRSKRFEGAGERFNRLLARLVVGSGDFTGEVPTVYAERPQAMVDESLVRTRHVLTVRPVPVGIAPEPGSGLIERTEQFVGIGSGNSARRLLADPLPARTRIGGIGDDGVVQIHQHRGGKVQGRALSMIEFGVGSVVASPIEKGYRTWPTGIIIANRGAYRQFINFIKSIKNFYNTIMLKMTGYRGRSTLSAGLPKPNWVDNPI